MPWDNTARLQHSRDGLRYPSDLADREWSLIAPLLPPARRGGRPRTTSLRAVTNAILYVAISGCQWRMLPKDFPPVSTVRGYFYAWRNAGLWQVINHLLVASTRELEGREAKGRGDWTIDIIKRSDTAKGFEVLPRRWVVERTFAWLGRCRRLAKDWETSIESSTAWTFIASIKMMARRLATYCYPA